MLLCGCFGLRSDGIDGIFAEVQIRHAKRVWGQDPMIMLCNECYAMLCNATSEKIEELYG